MYLGSVAKAQQSLANWMIAYFHGDALMPESPTCDTLNTAVNNVSVGTPHSGLSTTHILLDTIS